MGLVDKISSNKEALFLKLSKRYFQFVAPVILVIVVACTYGGIVSHLTQKLLVNFLALYYVMIWFSKIFFGAAGDRTVKKPQKIDDDGESFRMLEEIALREYEYIRETMAQAMNDRHTLVNYFLLAAGVVIAAIGVIYSDEGMKYSVYKKEISIAICLAFAVIAWIYIMKVVRLRQAWCESSAAMNQIKQFFLQNVGISDKGPHTPFRWRSSTIPKAARTGNLYHLEILLISFIASLAIAAVSVLLLEEGLLKTNFGIPIAAFVFNFLMLSSTYSVFLEEKEDVSAEGIDDDSQKDGKKFREMGVIHRRDI